MLDLETLDFEKSGGTVTVITQDAVTGAVLMIAQADREALERTIESGEMHYRSRSRGLWHKGATSGNFQTVVSLTADCDGDAVLARVIPKGPACHSGAISCFGDIALQSDALSALDLVIASRARDLAASSVSADGTPTSYTQRLLADRNLRLKKLGEETAELVVACVDEDAGRATEEAADVLYHLLVALRSVGVTLADLRQSLAQRAK